MCRSAGAARLSEPKAHHSEASGKEGHGREEEGGPEEVSARTTKSDRRKVRKVLGDGVPMLLEAHEDGLNRHAEILNRTILAGFWGRLRWLFFGVRLQPRQVRGRFARLRDRLTATDVRAWRSISAGLHSCKPGPPVLEPPDAA